MLFGKCEMFKKTTLLAFGAVAFLAACGGGEPSEGEMKSALETEMSKAEVLTGKIDIVSFKKDKCTAEGEKYLCSFELEVSLKNPLTGEQEQNKDTATGVFTRVDDKWVVTAG